MGFAKADSLFNNIFLSLHVRRGDWWLLPEFGSRLHLLRKNTSSDKAKEYIKEALAWLKTAGRIEELSVDVAIAEQEDGKTRLNAVISVTRPDNTDATFNLFIPLI